MADFNAVTVKTKDDERISNVQNADDMKKDFGSVVSVPFTVTNTDTESTVYVSRDVVWREELRKAAVRVQVLKFGAFFTAFVLLLHVSHIIVDSQRIHQNNERSGKEVIVSDATKAGLGFIGLILLSIPPNRCTLILVKLYTVLFAVLYFLLIGCFVASYSKRRNDHDRGRHIHCGVHGGHHDMGCLLSKDMMIGIHATLQLIFAILGTCFTWKYAQAVEEIREKTSLVNQTKGEQAV